MKEFSQTVRFVVGLIVMYAIYQLHNAGVFVRIGNLFDLRSPATEFGGVTDVLMGVVPVLVDSITFIGSIALTFSLFIWRGLKPYAIKLAVLLDKKLEGYGVDLYEIGGVYEAKAPKGLDIEKLTATLQDLADRLELIEQGYNK